MSKRFPSLTEKKKKKTQLGAYCVLRQQQSFVISWEMVYVLLHRELDHLEETPALLLAASDISNASNVPVIR